MSGDPQGGDSTDNYSKAGYNKNRAPEDDRFDAYSQPMTYQAKGLFGQTETREPVFDTRPTVSQYKAGAGTGLNANYVDVPNPNYGNQVGYTSDALPGIGTAIGSIFNDGQIPQVYTGDNRFNPFGDPTAQDPGQSSGDFNNAGAMRNAELAAARQRRAAALGNQQSALANAFGIFNDDFYGDLESAYRDFQNPLLTQGYDASLRGIYDGFKAQGLLKQSDVDAAIAGLDTSKAAEMERIGQGAAEYAQAKRDEIAKRQSALGDQLAALAGGATTAADVDAQTAAINAFDFSKDIDKLKTPGAKGGLNFFQGYNQVAAQANPAANVAAQSVTGVPQTGSITPVTSTGIASPFGSKSIRVV